MSSQQTISTGTSIIVGLPNNTCLPIGSLISGYGVTAGTQISAQTGPYTYTISPSQTIIPKSMISNPTNYYLDLDIQDSDGLTILTPQSNFVNIQFLKADELTLMPKYTRLYNYFKFWVWWEIIVSFFLKNYM